MQLKPILFASAAIVGITSGAAVSGGAQAAANSTAAQAAVTSGAAQVANSGPASSGSANEDFWWPWGKGKTTIYNTVTAPAPTQTKNWGHDGHDGWGHGGHDGHDGWGHNDGHSGWGDDCDEWGQPRWNAAGSGSAQAAAAATSGA